MLYKPECDQTWVHPINLTRLALCTRVFRLPMRFLLLIIPSLHPRVPKFLLLAQLKTLIDRHSFLLRQCSCDPRLSQ